MFDRLAGNQRVKDVLRRMSANNRVPGAMLFAGEDGVGKRLFAVELAKALNCRDPQKGEACERCTSCVRISQSKFPEYSDDKENKEKLVWADHADVALARPFGRVIRIGPMREIEREANFRPFEGRARVFIVEDADKLNPFSANALLKTLEEPPATTHIILITSRPDSLLPTIRSRCQVVRFAPLAAEEIESYLKKSGKVAAEDAKLLARAAGGSMGRAVSADAEKFRQQREAMLGLLDSLALRRNRAGLLRASEEMNDAKRKDEYEPRLDVLATLIHDLWVLTFGPREQSIVNEDLRPQLSKMGAQVESRRAAAWLSQIEAYRLGLDVNINRKVGTDALFLSMADA